MQCSSNHIHILYLPEKYVNCTLTVIVDRSYSYNQITISIESVTIELWPK